HDPAPTAIYPLSLHDALPICRSLAGPRLGPGARADARRRRPDLLLDARRPHVCGADVDGTHRVAVPRRKVRAGDRDARALLLLADRKSTRLNSSHDQISYAVF